MRHAKICKGCRIVLVNEKAFEQLKVIAVKASSGTIHTLANGFAGIDVRKVEWPLPTECPLCSGPLTKPSEGIQ